MGGEKVHPDEEEGTFDSFKEKAKPLAKWCCFWLRVFPPIRAFLGFLKWLVLSKTEYKLLKTSKKLFKVVNVSKGWCADCPCKKLSKLERMYFHRVLRDEGRWGDPAYRQFVEDFREQVVQMQREESDLGENITEEEFTSGVMFAASNYILKIVKKMKDEIKKEYEKDEEMASAP
eukprot:TRINITY_DN75017_c0_g1_i1.p1 TRINITY_DN75017_c0_g1~~TRINITY_DN75017_c0_g1_i1.p1  ORF type:complete len:175 (-),score=50.08 TRINITY_DN75017_c0_g1_i1:181-705(-)